MAQNDRVEVATYGGWRRSRGIGLLNMSPGGTVLVMVTIAMVLLAGAVSLTVAAYLVGPAVVLVFFAVAQWQGAPLIHVITRRVRWWWGSLHGHTSYRAGIVVEHPRAWQLPGVLAPTELFSAEDSYGGQYGVVWDKRSGLLTATLRCAATSTWLANPGDSERWVANWGAWLASLGYMPEVRWVAVTVDTAPDPGSTLREQVEARMVPTAPEPALQIMEELVRRSPGAAADVDTHVSITFDPQMAASKPKNLDESVAEFGRTLHGLQSQLSNCGVTVLGRATAPQLAGTVRRAFDPASRGEVNRLLQSPTGQELLTWADAGPVGAEEAHDHYRHDSGISVSWGWNEAPRQRVHSGVLARLVAPGTHPKRVTLMYRPYSAAASARLLEAEVQATAFRAELSRRQGKDSTARDHADRERAHRAATEEATGAGVCLVSLYVTVTVQNEDDLAAAVADVVARSETAKIRLRRLTFSQAAGFATTLPCGVHPAELSRRWPR